MFYKLNPRLELLAKLRERLLNGHDPHQDGTEPDEIFRIDEPRVAGRDGAGLQLVRVDAGEDVKLVESPFEFVGRVVLRGQISTMLSPS